ncbi:hypothetical protein EUX98_g2922 [Antrodiella citrinella]|uniref:Uncharacterized protein n=1 Tax=Antrodiella citrinella TaxID=2447956 RepID=A0A4S4MXS9_9APHY|nr:hypothetical protein EUX98_g2922 [Antrodiella citrinella]
MSIPPEYSQTHKDLQKAIDNPVALTDQQKADALNKLGSDVSTPASEQALVNEIDALAGAALEVDTSFDNITACFKKIKTSGARPELIKDVNDLMSTWQAHHNTFTNLLWESRQVAGKAQGAADDFAKDFITFLADDDVSLAEKKDEIKNYIGKLTEDEEASKHMSQGFTDLEKNVQAFQVEWKRVIDKYKLDAISARIAELDGIIANLETALNDLNDKIKALAISLGVLSAATGVTAALGFICPWFWIGTLLGLIGVGVTAALLKKAMDERTTVEADIARNKADRAMEEATLAAVKELKAALDASQGDFNVICSRLGAFAHVWATIRADIQAIEEKLDYAHGTESKALFRARLNTAAKLYATLGKALRRYQVVVNKDDALRMRVGK